MRFGIFYEHQLPRPWDDGRASSSCSQDALDQVELADRLGFDYVWEVEHHFLEEYSHSLGARGVPRRRQPAHASASASATASSQTAARLSTTPRASPSGSPTLDLVSDGRVEFGTGRVVVARPSSAASASTATTKREQWDEALDVVTRMFVEEPFAGYDGRVRQMPPRNVVPKPMQKPHPPLWVACSRRETILLAAEKGIGALSFSFVEPEEAKEWVDEYYAIIASDECVPGGFAVNPNVAVVLPMMCHADEADGDRARHRRRALLRLLARPLLRVRRPPARASRTSGRSSRSAATRSGFARDDRHARPGAARA